MSGGAKANAHSNVAPLRTRTPALRDVSTTPLRAVVAARAAAALAPMPEGATPAVSASAPLIVSTAVAPAPLGFAPVLRMLTPVARVFVVVPWKPERGLAGPRALERRSLVSSMDHVDEGGARRRSSRGDPLQPESGESGSRPRRRPSWMGIARAKPFFLTKPNTRMISP